MWNDAILCAEVFAVCTIGILLCVAVFAWILGKWLDY